MTSSSPDTRVHAARAGRRNRPARRVSALALTLVILAAGALAGGGCAAGRGLAASGDEAARAAARRAARTPAHTDHFAGAAELERALDRAAAVAGELARAASAPGPFAAAVVPHHLVAGHLAAGLFAYLAADPPATVVIIGPDHRNAGPAVGTSYASWQTASGTVESDVPLVAALFEEGLAGEDWAAQDGEHSVGALMPFLARFLPGTKVVALTVRRDVTLEEAEALGRFLRDWADSAGGAALFVVASVDFSHYLPKAEADLRDAATLEALETPEWTALFGMGPSNLDSPASLAAAAWFGAEEGAAGFQAVLHTNSADLLGQPDLSETTSHFLFLVRPKSGR